jgi:hypothetical protein
MGGVNKKADLAKKQRALARFDRKLQASLFKAGQRKANTLRKVAAASREEVKA